MRSRLLFTSSADKAKCVKTPTKNNSGLSAVATAGIALGCAIPIIALVIFLLILVSQVFDSIIFLKTGLMIVTFKF